jgi:hypothetical protein
MKKALAMAVGTIALPITVATKCEYCVCVMMLWFSPNNAEIVPNVRPVDIISEYYIPWCPTWLKARTVGTSGTIFETIFAASRMRNTNGLAMRAGTDTKDPARMK